MKIKIRKAKKEDAIQIANVEKKSGYHFGKWDFLQAAEDLFKDKNEIIFVAEVNGDIIGYRSFNKKGRLADSGYLAISKEFQGKGIGRELLEKSIREAKKLGCNKMFLHVRKSNLRAISLYKRIGFCEIKSEKKGRVIKLTMEKNL